MRICPQCSESCDASHRFCPTCGYPVGAISSEDSDAMLGVTLPGGYVILELIGVGGMGRVYRAEQTALGRTVAVKIIHPSLLGDESAAARFITEARTASLLNHPNSVSVIDFGKTDNGQLYLVMEFLRGVDLARVMYDDGPLPFVRIIDILRQVLAALAEAHHLAIIHRDLKPENVVIEPMRTGGDFVKVVDFGLAKLLTGNKGPGITATGIVCGTPDYMSPEQGRGDPLDARSDLYAVGVILFQLLTSKLPFEAESPTQVVLMHLTVPAPDPRTVAPDRGIPAALAMVTLSALAKKKDERYQDADAFSTALLAVRNQMEAVSSRRPQPTDGLLTCPECGLMIPRGQRFCGECGARVGPSSKPAGAPPSKKPGPRAADALGSPRGLVSFPLPFVAREEDFAWLRDRQAEATSRLIAARVIGAPGIGKTRLLGELCSVTRAEGGVVVEVTPDPWWAEVGYFALRHAVSKLTDLSANGFDPAAVPGASVDARSGLAAVMGRGTRKKGEPLGTARREAAAALRWSVRRAAEMNPGRPLLICIEDLHRIDGASRNAFADLLGEPPDVPILVVAEHAPGFDARWPGHFPARLLHGLGLADVAALMGRGSNPGALATMQDRGIPPMFVEQYIRFMREAGTEAPANLADLVALRLARLNASSRRVLQALAVLGAPASNEHVAAMVDAETDVQGSIGALTKAGMVQRTEAGWSISHPLIREIAAVTVPAGVRRELHACAGNAAVALNMPIEARALHALLAQDAFEALVLHDQVGESNMARDDIEGAVMAFRRGLEIARKEIFRGELDDPMRAVVIFSRKLGDALASAGDVTDADGVLREALDLADANGEDRAKVLFSLANVARARHRSEDAMRYLREAIDVAHHSGAQELVLSFEEAGRAWAS